MNKELLETTIKLSQFDSFKYVCPDNENNHEMPSTEVLNEVVNLTRSILFPKFFGDASVNMGAMMFFIGVKIDRLNLLLAKQISDGISFDSTEEIKKEIDLIQIGKDKATEFIKQLPEIREKLHKDVIAAYNGDPAAKSYGEVIFCYPGIRAISNYRIAHALLKLDVPLIPRIITEMAHSETGIDIHPGATIGEYFTIDHGTGVVIGETATIGNNVKMYQGVTLGAKSFPLDEQGNPIKGIIRHPQIGNDVIIYSNSTIVGTVKVGDGAIIGGNYWVDTDVPAGAKLIQKR